MSFSLYIKIQYVNGIASLRYVDHMTEAVQAVKSTRYYW